MVPNSMHDVRLILGSRSPRRLELLRLIVPDDCIEVLPPRSTTEAGFEGLVDWHALERRLTAVARAKCDDVLEQLELQQSAAEEPNAVVIAADTIIVATRPDDSLVVLGQPPPDDAWTEVVRQWFREYYLGKTHTAVTAVCVATALGRRVERVVKSEVTVRPDAERWLDWYIATEEPRGKAGGYAIQGAASIFISHVEGSISNVVGLPLEALLETFKELGIDVG